MILVAGTAHGLILERFAALTRNGRLAHAYLLVGPHSVGKAETALAIARLLVCENNQDGKLDFPCEECPACRKVNAGSHLDVFFLNAGEETSIKIAAIRELIQRLQLRPFAGGKKIVVIKDAELMTAESANAFLKTLEEPPRDTVLLLTTSSPELLLATIKSRCQIVYLFPGARQKVEAALAQEFRFDAKAAHFLSCFTDGCIGRARQLGEGDFLRRKNEVIDRIVLSASDEAYTKELLGDKERTRESLEILLTWFRDIWFLKLGAEKARLINADRVMEIEKAGAVYGEGQLQEIIAGIEQALKMLDENFNVKIAFYLLMEKIWAR